MGVVIGWAMVLAPLTSALLMGVIGYPFYRRRAGGMEAFQRTGIFWWFGTLLSLVILGVIAYPEFFAVLSPSRKSSVPPWLVLMWIAIGVVVALAVEWVDDRIGPRSNDDEGDRFRNVLPSFSRSDNGLRATVTVIAVLEEAAFRALMLGFLLSVLSLQKPIAAGVCSIIFGLSHWWYGARQVVLKSFVGGAFCFAALGAGWIAAVVSHVLFNLIIAELSIRPRTKSLGTA